MNASDAKKNIIIALENVGIYVDFNTEESITNIIEDSLSYVSFIVELENLLGYEIEDSFLAMEEITIDGLSEMLALEDNKF